jgi:CheY-like chemotaxis protein
VDHYEWLGQVNEAIVEPDRPICDPHHHLWDHPNNRYLLDELLADLGSGHNIVSTVFVECASMYRADGPERLRPVGETEFVNGIAAMTASGRYGDVRVCAGIVSFADLTLGTAVGEVLDLHMSRSDRFRGIRHAAGWDADERVRNSHTNPPAQLLLDRTFRAKWMATDVIGLEGRSDHAFFDRMGIPVGGLFSGADDVKSKAEKQVYGGKVGEIHDGCYHQACDTLANVNREVLDQLADGVAHAIATLAADPGLVSREN